MRIKWPKKTPPPYGFFTIFALRTYAHILAMNDFDYIFWGGLFLLLTIVVYILVKIVVSKDPMKRKHHAKVNTRLVKPMPCPKCGKMCNPIYNGMHWENCNRPYVEYNCEKCGWMFCNGK